MKKLIMLLVLNLFFISNTFSNEVIWKAGKQFVSLYEDKEQNLLYSNECRKSKCDALKLTKNLNWKNVADDATLGGKNPGAVLCKELLKQTIVYMKDLSGNENTFCLFKDNSVISSSSLSVLASKAKKKK